MSGWIKLLKSTRAVPTNIPKKTAGRIIVNELIPDARMAVISLSSDILPKDMRVAMRIAIGTASETIHARFKTRYSRMVKKSSPFPRNLSNALRKKLVNRTKIMMSKEKINGENSSFWTYLFKRRMKEIRYNLDSGIRNFFFALPDSKITSNFRRFSHVVNWLMPNGGCSSAG